jgi:hypothetical protein
MWDWPTVVEVRDWADITYVDRFHLERAYASYWRTVGFFYEPESVAVGDEPKLSDPEVAA